MPSTLWTQFTNEKQKSWRPWESDLRSTSQAMATSRPETPTTAIKRRMAIKCVVCHATFKRERELKRHIASVHRRRRVQCKKCGKKFTRQDNLIRHLKIAHSLGKPSCRFCKKTLSRQDAVQRHESTCPKNPVNYSDTINKSDAYTTMSHLETIRTKLLKSRLPKDAIDCNSES